MFSNVIVRFRTERPSGLEYVYATAAVAAATLLDYGLQLAIGFERASNGVFWFSVVWCGLNLGRAPAIFGAVLSAIVVDYLFIPPLYTMSDIPAELVRTLIMVAAAIYVAERARGPVVPRVLPWARPRELNHETGVALGEKLAEVFVHQRRNDRKVHLLGWKVKEIVRGGAFEGAEVGFFRGISRALLYPLDHAEHLNNRHGGVGSESDIRTAPVSAEERGREELPEREHASDRDE